MTIRELIEEQRRRMSSANPAERLAAALLIPGELTKRLDKLDDHEIGQLLDDEVGAKLNLFAPESTVCDAAVTRLRRRAKGLPKRNAGSVRPRATNKRRNSTRMKTAAIYVRVSTADQHVESQLYDLREFAASGATRSCGSIRDRGVSGKRARRPGSGRAHRGCAARRNSLSCSSLRSTGSREV